MCNLCGEKEDARRARNLLRIQAGDLRDLAASLEDMAAGSVKPHTDRAKTVSAKARSVIRYLVEDWM